MEEEKKSEIVIVEQTFDDLKGYLKGEMDDAEDFANQIGQERAESTDYYLGNEPVANSSLQSYYISTDVRDTVLFMLPQIMRTFFGTKKVVEFVPKNQEDIPVAQQQTDYINYILQEKNPGFQVLYDAFKDALVRKTGYVKAYWDDSLSSSTHEYTNILPPQYQALALDKDVEILEEVAKSEQITTVDPVSGQEVVQDIPVSYDVKIRRVKAKNQVVVESVPPEEILLARHSRTIKDSSYVAHRMIKTVSELVAMGYEQEEIEKYQGASGYLLDSQAFSEQEARNPYDNAVYPDTGDSKNVLYIEHFVYYDLDQDGIDELIRVCTLGNALHIINVEPCDDMPIVMFCPDPEPHTAIGSCPADYLKPIQAAKSQIVRDTLDSLGHAIFPRMGIVEGQVNIDDVLNTDIGQPIRMRSPGMVQPIQTPFVGASAFPVLNYLDEAKENRTGVSKASAGLNADALQSSTKAAVTATMSAAQGRIELICRHFAESGLKSLFSLINNLVIKHQEASDIFRLNNKFIPVDPRYWDNNKDIVVNVALSKSSDEEKISVLSQIATKQENILQTLGANNPLVNLQQYANTLSKIIEMSGFKDVSSFFNTEVPPIPVQQQSSQDNSAVLLAQAESQKAQVQAQKAIIDAETDRLKIIMDDDRQRDIEEAQLRLKAQELSAKYGTQINIAEINAVLERDRELIRQAQKSQAQGLFTNVGGSENI